MYRKRSLAIAIIAATASTAFAQHRGNGIEGKPAPAWSVQKWFNLPPGKTSIDIADYRDKVLYLFFFQAGCPGCHSRGFPTLDTLMKKYASNDDVQFVAVQTAFEGFGYNNIANAEKTAQQYKLKIPVGHSGEEGKRSEMMASYATGGTPWSIIVDRKGLVVFDDFFITPDLASTHIDQALRSGSKRYAGAQANIPKSRGGQACLGKPLDLGWVEWLNTDGKPVNTPGKVTLVRWWTDADASSARALPAIEKLRSEFGDDGFQTIAVYHPKPPREVEKSVILAAAKKLGYKGPVGTDIDWDVLYNVYRGKYLKSETSVTFVLDRLGIVRYVHPGPEFGPSKDAAQKQINQDYEDIRTTITKLLAESSP